jgi:peptidyl-tRNA hydrolase, PTH1 family
MSLLRALRAFLTGDATDDAPTEDMSTMIDRGRTRVVVGLGNPGRQYADTRHNFGFFVVDELARRTGAPTSRKRMKAEITESRLGDDKLVLVMPQTFMNASGVSVREVARWYHVPPEDVLVIVDDLDLPFGQIRIRARGSTGGHNGLKSIFHEMGTQEIPRLRIGIGRKGNHAIAHVLSRFSPEEKTELPGIIGRAADAVELWSEKGIIEAMNVTNGATSPV